MLKCGSELTEYLTDHTCDKSPSSEPRIISPARLVGHERYPINEQQFSAFDHGMAKVVFIALCALALLVYVHDIDYLL